MSAPRVLIAGTGDVALRVARLLAGRFRLLGLVRRPERAPDLRRAGIVPLPGDLDCPRSLGRIAGAADWVVHLAPPPNHGETDPRTRNLLNALAKCRMLPRALVYISTTGVYGDRGGAPTDETRPAAARTPRARRRVDAERQVRAWGRCNRVRAVILRVPGIYAAGRLPIARLQAGTAAIRAGEDSWTNHIHADDLARAIVAALARGQAGRVYNVCDDSQLKMGDYFDRVADRYGLPRPPRVSREEARRVVSPGLMSFMEESRRIVNARMKRELRLRLHYPTVDDALSRDPAMEGQAGA